MVLLIALLALSVWAIVATVVVVRRDGYRAVPTDWTRVAESYPADCTDLEPRYR